MDKPLTEAQRAYEAKRAAKAGVSLDRWLADKRRQQAIQAKAAIPATAKKPGLLSRLLDKAHQPIGAKPADNPKRRA